MKNKKPKRGRELVGQLLTAVQAAAFLHLHKSRVLKFARSSRLPFHRLGNQLFFDRTALAKFKSIPRPPGKK